MTGRQHPLTWQCDCGCHSLLRRTHCFRCGQKRSPGNSLRPATPAAAVRDRLPATPPAGDTTVAAGP